MKAQFALTFKAIPADSPVDDFAAAVVKASHGESILEALLRNKIEIDHSCGGMGSCGTCRIILERNFDKVSERNETEQEILGERGLCHPQERLACQTFPTDGLLIRNLTRSIRRKKD